MLGTTHFVNACVQRRGLAPVCAIRLCGPATQALPPFCDMPEALCDDVKGQAHLLSGELKSLCSDVKAGVHLLSDAGGGSPPPWGCRHHHDPHTIALVICAQFVIRVGPQTPHAVQVHAVTSQMHQVAVEIGHVMCQWLLAHDALA